MQLSYFYYCISEEIGITRFIVLLGSKIGGTTMSDGFAGGSTGDEIIELQDIRLSPIPSIRNRHNSARSVSLAYY